ncbi:MAG TPA: extracellular solute-binding protein, partial [Bacteroidetes bacterium]|nr:extracellular solute-binding protein [Bacteroidota bacterium]
PDTQVTMQPLPEGRSGEEVLIIAAAGETTPDICSSVPPVIVPLLARAGSMIPVDQFPGGRELIAERLPPGMLESFIAEDGKLYQVPWKGNPIMVQYNTGILEETGVDSLPRTWSEWNQAAAKVTRDRNGDGRIDQWMADIQIESEWRRRLFDFYTFYIAASEGRTLLVDGRVDFDNQIAVDVMGFFATGFREGWYPRSLLAGDMFLMGYFAAHVTGPWNIAHTERLKPEGFRYAFGPIPVPDDYEGEPFTFGDPKSIGIFSNCRYPGAAWAFVRFLISRESDRKLLEIADQLPLRDGLLSDTLFADYFAAHPNMRVFARLVPHTRGFDQSPALQEVFDAISNGFDGCAVNGVITPEEAVRQAAERSRYILKMRGA